jgi:hypothetical protein
MIRKIYFKQDTLVLCLRPSGDIYSLRRKRRMPVVNVNVPKLLIELLNRCPDESGFRSTRYLAERDEVAAALAQLRRDGIVAEEDAINGRCRLTPRAERAFHRTFAVSSRGESNGLLFTVWTVPGEGQEWPTKIAVLRVGGSPAIWKLSSAKIRGGFLGRQEIVLEPPPTDHARLRVLYEIL